MTTAYSRLTIIHFCPDTTFSKKPLFFLIKGGLLEQVSLYIIHWPKMPQDKIECALRTRPLKTNLFILHHWHDKANILCTCLSLFKWPKPLAAHGGGVLNIDKWAELHEHWTHNMKFVQIPITSWWYLLEEQVHTSVDISTTDDDRDMFQLLKYVAWS